ncbi:MAG: helix-turn-helix transcriptional regulator [Bacteroidia bacterium]|jgi:DNA-binding transcriptional ArsR family regulator|nr:helix-turn-helix transcriptional regulator [Bacteroidota bacterium]MBP6511937.1 helix-turn-helix transcriptional regulator [Bacteroidia bacterium]MBP7243680.1 helix-turn-helix transcriptional regulator [Bacteroidia bacterium]
MAIHSSKSNKAASFLKVIANPTRIEIISLLAPKKKLSVNQLCLKLNIEQSLVSHHLKNMRTSGILEATRDGINIYYSIAAPHVLEILKLSVGTNGVKK